MSTRASQFYQKVTNATGEEVTVHVFRDGWLAGLFIEVTVAGKAVAHQTMDDVAALDSTALFALAKKVRAAERAQAFIERFGFGLWRGDHP